MQIFHQDTRDRPYHLLQEASDFVSKNLSQAVALVADAQALRFASDAVSLDGYFLELGVFKGRTINFISALNPTKTIYGFDWFKGLPEDWQRPDKSFLQHSFALPEGELPSLNPNVVIQQGLFKDSLPVFCKGHLKPDSVIAFLHVDCDLYTSTCEAFYHLGPYLRKGSVIAFDEFYNYPGFVNHEYKAFYEFLKASDLDVEYLAYNKNHEQVIVRLA